MQEAKNALRVGDCQRASDNYDMAKKLDGISDADVEKAIALCIKNSEADTSVIQSEPAKDSVFTCDYLDYYIYMDGVVMTYEMAKVAVKKSKFCNYSKWRMPTIDELQKIVDYHYKVISKEIEDYRFWSLTKNSSGSLYTYKVDSRSTYSSTISNKFSCIFVRDNKGEKKK